VKIALWLAVGLLPVAAVNARTPSTFIAIGFADRFTLGALHYFAALQKAKVRSELHVFQLGGHGCGLRPTDATITTWPAHCERWLRDIKVLPTKQ
jgi:acetyl esterase/lipase